MKSNITIGPLYYEDFKVGDTFITHRKTITETDVVNFVHITGFLEPLFIDAEYALNKSIFKKRIAPGLLTIAVSMGLFVKMGYLAGTGLALIGIERIDFKAPVAIGDTIYSKVEVVEKRETKRPERGIVTLKWAVQNQENKTVAEYVSKHLVLRRTEERT